MTIAEKRAQLEAEGKPWPVCDCHGEPKGWSGKQFRCKVKHREDTERRRAKRRAAGICVWCTAPAHTKTLCERHADSHVAAQWAHEQKPEVQLRKYLSNYRGRNKTSPSTEGGRAAVAAALLDHVSGATEREV